MLTWLTNRCFWCILLGSTMNRTDSSTVSTRRKKMNGEKFAPSFGPSLEKVINALASIDEVITSTHDTRCLMFGRPNEDGFIEVIPTAMYRNRRDRGTGVSLTLVGHDNPYGRRATCRYENGVWTLVTIKPCQS